MESVRVTVLFGIDLPVLAGGSAQISLEQRCALMTNTG
jgi:hypothetical protein